MLDAALLKRALQVPMALEDGEEFTDVVTDSRAIVPGCLFVALKGEKFDGHRFVAQALEDGARAAVVSEVPEGVAADRCVVVARYPDGLPADRQPVPAGTKKA